jgi:hypothetical protein
MSDFPRGPLPKSTSAEVSAARVPREESLFRAPREGASAADASRKRARSATAKPSGGASAAARAPRASSAFAEAGGDASAGSSARAAELTARRLRVGLPLLARVRRVTSRAVVLALPSGLTAHAAVEDVNDDVAAAVRDGKATLDDFFTTGQFVAAVVVRIVGRGGDSGAAGGGGADGGAAAAAVAAAAAIMGTGGATKARRVAVSLRPAAVNAGVSKADLRVGGLAWGCVKSVEDHGLLISLDVDGASVGFLPFADVPKGEAGQVGIPLAGCSARGAADPRNALVGGPILCGVASVDGKSVTLTARADGIAKTIARAPAPPLRALVPGTKVSAVITSVLSNGVGVSVLGVFTGSIALSALPTPAHARWAEAFEIGQTLSTRVRLSISLSLSRARAPIFLSRARVNTRPH